MIPKSPFTIQLGVHCFSFNICLQNCIWNVSNIVTESQPQTSERCTISWRAHAEDMRIIGVVIKYVSMLGKAAIPHFSIRIRMRISMRIRKISMQIPYSTFQYPSNVSACFYLTLNSAYIKSLSFTWKFNTFYTKCGDSKLFLSYIRVTLQG